MKITFLDRNNQERVIVENVKRIRNDIVRRSAIILNRAWVCDFKEGEAEAFLVERYSIEQIEER